MDEQFDKDIVNRIREVFEHYEDHSADAGWLRLRKKFPDEESRRRPVAWFWRGAAAALLFLGLGLGLLIYNNRVEPEKTVRSKAKSAQSETMAKSKPTPVTNHPVAQSGTKTTYPGNGNTNHVAATQTAHLTNGTDLKAFGKSAAIKGTGLTVAKNEIVTKNRAPELAARAFNIRHIAKISVGKNVPANLLIQTKPGAIVPGANNEQAIAANTAPVKGSSLAKIPAMSGGETIDGFQANRDKTTQSTASVTRQVKNDSAVQKQPSKSISTLFANEKQMNVSKNEVKITAGKKVNFSVYAATYFNYAKGSDNQVNVGAGFTSDIPITAHLKLVTGITLAQNSLNFTGSIPVTAQQSTLVAASTPKAAAPMFASSYLAPVVKPTFQSYNASLVGLDVPINLKYEFSPQKNSAYISAGLSSGTFVDETYTYKYNYPAFFSPSLQQTQGATAHNSFNNFYFAKTLNVAFGTAFPFGRNRLIVEPFLKYPLDGMGTQQLRFGAGGVNLKFNFQPSKK